MDPEGPWSLEMIEMMLDEAMAIETNRKRATHEATLSAIAAAFSKTEVGYDPHLGKVLAGVNDGRLLARGIAPTIRHDEAVENVMKILRSGKPRRKK